MQISSSFEVKTLFEFSTCYIRCRNGIQSQSLEIFMEHENVLSNHYMRIKIAEILWDPHSYYLEMCCKSPQSQSALWNMMTRYLQFCWQKRVPVCQTVNGNQPNISRIQICNSLPHPPAPLLLENTSEEKVIK